MLPFLFVHNPISQKPEMAVSSRNGKSLAAETGMAPSRPDFKNPAKCDFTAGGGKRAGGSPAAG